MPTAPTRRGCDGGSDGVRSELPTNRLQSLFESIKASLTRPFRKWPPPELGLRFSSGFSISFHRQNNASQNNEFGCSLWEAHPEVQGQRGTW
jgi:hypothetical protein